MHGGSAGPDDVCTTGQNLAAFIEAGGVERTIFGSDLGQFGNPTPVQGFARMGVYCSIRATATRISAPWSEEMPDPARRADRGFRRNRGVRHAAR